ncbi:hypothetical protein ACH5RR_009177 [Cinchona calisaya]|uniref:Uncharacterized protein n=1 Tax=Cinchona calisaya TaxID=153742 RepID=A0ABD3AGZ1_9GENT
MISLKLQILRIMSLFNMNGSKDLDKLVEDICEGPVTLEMIANRKHKNFDRFYLPWDMRIWKYLVCVCFLPTSHSSDVTLDRAYLVHYLKLGRSINLRKILND